MPLANSKPTPSVTDGAQATAGAFIDRHAVAMKGLLHETFVAYKSATREGLLSDSEPMGMNPPNAHHFKGEDAFRHAFSSVRASQAFGAPIANLLGRGNEMLAAATRENDTTLATARDIGMDLHNNRVGREIYQSLPSDAGMEQIRDAVISAGRAGRLIITTDDPRALKEYNAQYDMKGLSAANEKLADASREVSGSVKEGVHAAREAVESGRQRVDQAVTVLDKSLKSYAEALKEALRHSGDSPFFSFSEKQLQDGEKCGRALDPRIVSAISDAAGHGQESCMTNAEFQKQMAALSSLTAERKAADPAPQQRQESAERATAQMEHQGAREM